MKSIVSRSLLCGTAALLVPCFSAHAQYTTPNVISTAGDVSTTLGGTTFINHGLQGVGRISGSTLDSFGETFGSVSGLQITNWAGTGGNYTGTFNVLPDRGFVTDVNPGDFFADYSSRLHTLDFSFTPYTGSTNIGGADLAAQIAAQNQISITSGISSVKFTYADPISGNPASFTSGLEPSGGQTIFGQTLPYITNYTGQSSPGGSVQTYNNINKLALDAEALVLKADGSGYIGDEIGANVYHFNSSKQIVGVIVPPEALRPHSGALDFETLSNPTDGRRGNQGFEGVSLSPDGTKLFAMLQSATMQDTGSGQQTRLNARLVIYDVSGSATPGSPTAEYVIKLPTYRLEGSGSAVNATAAQSEIIAIDNNRLLVLSRDANGQGQIEANPSVFKSVLLVDLSVGNPTNIAGTARDAQGGQVDSSAGVLDPLITPLSWTEAINILNSTQLSKFNIDLDLGGANQVTKRTLGEKWEGMSLVSANDPLAPNDFYLFVANDNDFFTSNGSITGPGGNLLNYNGLSSHPTVRYPDSPGGAPTDENDTMFLAYRVTIIPEPGSACLLAGAAGLLSLRRRSRAQ